MLFYYRKVRMPQKHAKNCEVYSENDVSERRTQEWFARFRSGNLDVADASHSGRPVTGKVVSCQEIAEALNINHMTV